MDRHHSRCYSYFGDQHSHYSYFSRAISHWNRVGMDLFGDDNKPGRSAKISDCISATLLLFTCEVMSNSVTPGNAARQGPLFSSVSWSLLRFAHWVSDAIWPSHPVTLFFFCPQSFPASGSFPMSQLSHQVAKVLEIQLQDQPFQWIFRVVFLKDQHVWSPCSTRDS